MTLTQINKAGLDEIALDHVFTIGASGSSAYTFQGEGLNGTVNNPTLYLTRGKTYRFENGSGGHPIRIQSTSGASGTAYNTGVTNNAGSGTVIVEVQHDAPDVLYYQCTSHAAMNGILYITGALADGGVTEAKIAAGAVSNTKIAQNAVGTTSIAADAITNALIADNAVENANIANNAVTTAKIADEAVTLAKLPHGTSSNDGKFLRANNGADPTFETVSGTTINNNADNRVITGSGTANTLEGEASLTWNGTEFLATADSGVPQLSIENTSNSAREAALNVKGKHSNGTVRQLMLKYDSADRFRIHTGGSIPIGFETADAERMRIDGNGSVYIGTTGYGGGGASPILYLRSTSGRQVKIHSTSAGTCGMQLSNSTTGEGEDSGFQLAVLGTGDGYINNPTSKAIRFSTNNTERMRILAGGGLTFNGDTAEANALDDYEFGTFTPTCAVEGQSNSSLSTATGLYVKVGKTVHVWFEVEFNGTPSNRTTGNAWEFGGFPFLSQNDTDSSHAGLRDYRFPLIAIGVNTGSTYGSNGHFLLRLNDNATGGRIEWQHSDFTIKNASLFIQSGTYVQFGCTYPTSM